MFNHEPVEYRSPWQDRYEAPADLCSTCTDFETGQLVPVSFCTESAVKFAEEDAWLWGSGPRPEWLDMPDAARWTPAG